MRSALASRLAIALGVLGLVAAAAPAHTGRQVAPVRSAAFAPWAPGELAKPALSAQRRAPALSAPARQVSKPARALAPRPAARAPAHPLHRSTSARHVSSARPATKPPSKPAPKPKPKPPPPKPKPPSPPPPPSGASNSAYESRILGLVNAQRVSHRLSTLSMSSCADSYAERWSAHLAAIAALVHQSMSGLLAGCHAQYVGENVGYGAVSADAMVAMWMASPGHRANILNPRFTSIGIGASQTSGGVWYAVQDFLDL